MLDFWLGKPGMIATPESPPITTVPRYNGVPSTLFPRVNALKIVLYRLLTISSHKLLDSDALAEKSSIKLRGKELRF